MPGTTKRTTLTESIRCQKHLTPLFSFSKPLDFCTRFPFDLPIETQLCMGWLDRLGVRGLGSAIPGRGGAEKTLPSFRFRPVE